MLEIPAELSARLRSAAGQLQKQLEDRFLLGLQSTHVSIVQPFVIVVSTLSTREAACVRGHRSRTSTGEGRT